MRLTLGIARARAHLAPLLGVLSLRTHRPIIWVVHAQSESLGSSPESQRWGERGKRLEIRDSGLKTQTQTWDLPTSLLLIQIMNVNIWKPCDRHRRRHIIIWLLSTTFCCWSYLSWGLGPPPQTCWDPMIWLTDGMVEFIFQHILKVPE